MNNLDQLLQSINLKDIKSEQSFEDLPDGYYLCEVEKVEFTVSKSSGNDMLKWQFKVVENGVDINVETDKKIELKNTKNRKIFMYHTLKDTNTIERMLSDLLKFEDSNGEPLLSPEYFISQEAIVVALQLLLGKNIYISLRKDDNDNQWKRIITWKAAKTLELI